MAYGETAHADITFLLAGAADEVEIGIAPYQAVVRGGRRRRARRWAVASAAALVIAGSTGTMALAGIGGGGGDKVTHVAVGPSTAAQRHVYVPQRTTIAKGEVREVEWWVSVGIWGAPRNEAEAVRQFKAMTELGVKPPDAKIPKDLVGKGSFFVSHVAGDTRTTVMLGRFDKTDAMAGTDLESVTIPLVPEASGRPGAPNGLVIGKVASTAREVTCTGDDGTTRVIRRYLVSFERTFHEPVFRKVKGSQAAWFVCVAADGTAKGFKSVKVTR
ncbi:hypothetical protein [Streptomyces sp. NBC_00459]|uniref:hypothetical protein n=1 Tax=Streptomyces sp. NBC_00459 TaxID=2975749 RepID=UPI002E17E40B